MPGRPVTQTSGSIDTLTVNVRERAERGTPTPAAVILSILSTRKLWIDPNDKEILIESQFEETLFAPL